MRRTSRRKIIVDLSEENILYGNISRQGTSTPRARTMPRPQPPANRGLILLHAFAFVFGFTLVFTLLGLTASIFGQVMNAFAPILQRLGAILLFIFGLTTLGVFRWLASRIRQSTDLAANPAAAALVSILDFFNILLYSEKRVSEMHRVSRGLGLSQQYAAGREL